jgi:DNA (cytosine-5)-methyltransferase 1
MGKMSATKSPKVIELFAGVGGFRLGLDAAGWQTVFSNQWEPSTKAQHASSCYVANFGPDGHSNQDIKLVVDELEATGKGIPNADLLVGGFPCQDYSVAKSLNSSKGLEGKKGVLWWEIYRLISIKKPKLVFLENVDRLLKSPASQRGRDFAIMLRTLGDLGYRIEWRVVNAAEEGFPQRRIRVFIVALRNDVAKKLKVAKVEEYLTSNGVLGQAFLAEAIGEIQEFGLADEPEEITKNFNKGKKTSPFLNSGLYEAGHVWTLKTRSSYSGKHQVLGDVLADSAQVKKEYWVEKDRLPEWEYLKGAKSIARVHAASGKEYFFSEGKMAFPDSLSKPARTILTGEGGTAPSRFKHIVKIGQKHRRLMPLELERLNGFPDNWTQFDADGKELSDARRAFFMGNALVVGLIERVGRVLIKLL